MFTYTRKASSGLEAWIDTSRERKNSSAYLYPFGKHKIIHVGIDNTCGKVKEPKYNLIICIKRNMENR